MLTPANSRGMFFSSSWCSWNGCAMPPTLFEVSNITSIQYLLISFHFKCYEMLHPLSSKEVLKYFFLISIYDKEVSVNVNHSVFCCHYHYPSPSPCYGVAGVKFCPEAPVLGQYWKFPSTKPGAFSCGCTKLSALLGWGHAGLSQTLHTGICAEFIVFAVKILIGPLLPNWKILLPHFLRLFCLAKTRLTITVLFILCFVSDPEMESELESESELIRSPESEQPEHESAPTGVLMHTLFMPMYYASPHVTIMGLFSRYTNEKTVICTFIHFNNINTFYTLFTHTWCPSPHQTKKKKHTLTMMHTMCHIRNKILGYDRWHKTE